MATDPETRGRPTGPEKGLGAREVRGGAGHLQRSSRASVRGGFDVTASEERRDHRCPANRRVTSFAAVDPQWRRRQEDDRSTARWQSIYNRHPTSPARVGTTRCPPKKTSVARRTVTVDSRKRVTEGLPRRIDPFRWRAVVSVVDARERCPPGPFRSSLGGLCTAPPPTLTKPIRLHGGISQKDQLWKSIYARLLSPARPHH